MRSRNSKPIVLILGATGRTGSHLVHLPDFADVYDNIPQIIGQQPITFREFLRNNRASFKAA